MEDSNVCCTQINEFINGYILMKLFCCVEICKQLARDRGGLGFVESEDPAVMEVCA